MNMAAVHEEVTAYTEAFLLEQKFEWRGNYLAYEDLLTKINKIERGYVNAEKDFVDFLNLQIELVENFYRTLIAELDKKKYFKDWNRTGTRVPGQHPAFLCESVCEIERFALMNVQALQNLIMYHDLVSAGTLAPAYVWKIQRDDFCSQDGLHPLLLGISELYANERKAAKEEEEARKKAGREEKEEDNKKLGKDGMPTKDGKIERTAFERTSIKFWIPSDRLVRLVCAILRHQAVYCFSGGFAQLTSSTYFDNEDLEFYTSRLVKEEGSTLIRFRWYGELKDDSVIFVERKVHHEKWVLQSSVKERCTVKHANISDYIRGEFEETPSYTKKNPLFNEVRDTILQKKLKPCLKTEYLRTAFQLPDDDSVRLTMDINLNMLRELDVYELERMQDWHTPATLFPESALHRFPFGVLEVKLHAHLVDHPPEWLYQLMNSDMLIRVDKFSKYNHGVALLYPEQTKKKPYWFGGEFSHFFGKQSRVAQADAANQRVRGRSFFNNSISLTPTPGDRKPTNKWSSKQKTSDGKNPVVGVQRASSAKLLMKQGGIGVLAAEDFTEGPIEEDSIMRVFCGCLLKKKQRNAEANARRLRTEPKTFFANERTFIQWFNAAVIVVTLAISLRLFGGSYVTQLAVYGYIAIALIIMFYGLFMFIMRTIHLNSRVPSLYFSDTRGPLALFIVFMAVLVSSFVFQLVPRDVIYLTPLTPPDPYIKQDCKVPTPSSFVLPVEDISGLEYRSRTLMGCTRSSVFEMKLSADGHPTLSSGQKFVPYNRKRFPVSLDLFGFTHGPNEDTFFVGSAATETGVANLLEVSKESQEILRYFPLDGFHPNNRLGGLAWIPNRISKNGGYFLLGGPKSNDVYVYDVTFKTKDSKLPGYLIQTFVPVPGATSITALSYWEESSGARLAVQVASPRSVVIGSIDPKTGILVDGSTIAYGFDLKVQALATIPPFGDDLEFVAAVDSSTLVSYDFLASNGQISRCAIETLDRKSVV